MGRHEDDSESENPELDYGRWQHNARQALTSKRGQRALRDLREALLALPERRLISSALCTVGGPDQRFPLITDEETAATAAEWQNIHTPATASALARHEQQDRAREHADLTALIEKEGEGICLTGAYAWHQLILRQGLDEEGAFAALPTLADFTDEGSISDTARYVAKSTGLAFTLAWILADMNDNKWGALTPEQRWQAAVDWLDTQLDSNPAS